MTDRLEALRAFAGLVKNQTVILGWIEGPAALAANLMGLENFLASCVEEPEFAGAVMDWAAELAGRFARAQIAAGADMIGMGDAAASLVSPSCYARAIAPRETRLVEAIHAAGATARLHICGSVRGKYAAMEATRADIIDIDYPQPIAEARAAMRPQTVLAGNVSPAGVLLAGTPDEVRRAFQRCHQEAGPAYVVAPGCEVPPATPEANIRAMVAYARSVA
jgi:MtaA/CmuA family methyltransferase